MHSFLVSQPPPEFPPSPDCLHLSPDPSLTIDDVRKIQAYLSKKPLQSAQNTVIIHQAEKLTLPAQHALLKTLEEPPGNSQIYLVTAFPDRLLPTILSRVLISNPSKSSNPSDPSTFNLINLLLSTNSVGERMKLLDDQSFTRETFSQFLDSFEVYIHQSINSPHPPLRLRGGEEGVLFSLISDSRKYLSANVTLRLILDNFAINLL